MARPWPVLTVTGKQLTAQLCRHTKRDGPPGPPELLAIVSGGITQGTLRKRAAELGVPADSYATTTLEQVAATLLAAARGCSVGDIDIVDKAQLHHCVRERLASPSDDTLRLVATRFSRDTEAVVRALEEWWRGTDAGSDTDQRRLSRVLETVTTFHQDHTEELFDALATITTTLENELDRNTFLSRSHLVRAARDHLNHWSKAYPSIERVFIGSISVLDNPTLRFIITAAAHEDAPPIQFCVGAGTVDRFYCRIVTAAAAEGIEVPPPEPAEDDETVNYLRALARGDVTNRSAGVPGSDLDVEWVTVPRKRNEATYVMQAAGTVETDGRRGSEVLGVFPNAGEYQASVESASRRFNIPADVETRFWLAHTPLVRAVKATLELLASVQPTIDIVLKPLEYGALPSLDSCDTPLGDTELAAVRKEASITSGRLDDWADAFDSTACEPARCVTAFIREVRAHSRRAITGDGVTKLIRTIVENYPTCPRHALGRYRPHRVTIPEPYPSEKTRQDVRAVGKRTGAVISNVTSPSWSDVVETFTEALAGAGTGRSRNDAMAVQIIDAGNSHFRKAPWVIIGGLSAGEFPKAGTDASLIPDSVRTAVADAAETEPYLYFDSIAAQVDRAVDEYVAALRCATERVTLLRPERDDDGRKQAPSRFVTDLMRSDVGRTYPLDYHETDGFIAPTATPDWTETPPASVHERLSVLGLNGGPTLAGQQADVRSEHSERLVDIAAMLDEPVAAELDRAQGRLKTMLKRPRLPSELGDGLAWNAAVGPADANAD